jgi:hypothetical protein
VKLKDAMFCVGCEEIFQPEGVYRFEGGDMASCPSCGCIVTVWISKWLNRYETGRPASLEGERAAPKERTT